jgi:uncharacterized protein (DUF885 family)
MIRVFALAALIAVIPFVAAAQSPADGALQSLLTRYDALERQYDPVTAGQEGDREALRRWADVTPQAAARFVQQWRALRTEAAALPGKDLSPDAALNLRLFLYTLDNRLALAALDRDRMPFWNDGAFVSEADYVARTLPIRTEADAEAWLARLESLPAVYAANLANARRGLKDGFVQPRVVAVRTLEVVKGLAPDPKAPERSALSAPMASLPATIPAERQAALQAKARAIIAGKVAPAYAEVVRFTETEYLPKARAKLAARDLPSGEAYYRTLVKFHTTTDLTPDQIHEIGLAEVKRIRARMDETIRASGFKGSFADFQAFLRTDPRFYAATPDDLLEKASRLAKRADDAMPGLFATLPRLPYGVRPVPAEIAEGYTTGRYWQGSPDQGIAGAYIVNTSKLDQRGLHELPALTLHEGVPGHHHQIALAQERKDLPSFRRNSYVTAFVEGWGLYAEYLGEEIGFYRTPYEMFGRLSYEMWRACRLVADTGLHWKRWTLAQARQCFDDNTALSPHNITTELERYVAEPGQALAYKIGEIELRRLRTRAAEALGPRFDVRRFHDAILLDGPMPLNVLGERVDAWIATAGAADRPQASPRQTP